MNESSVLASHLADLAERSYQNSIYTFTNFLSEADVSVLVEMEKELQYAGIRLFGGTETSERVVARFGREQDFGYDQEFPILCLQIDPLSVKFGEELSHRDYLGALMNLGIERELLGDILICGKTAYVFCIDRIAGYIMENLTQVRHTNVSICIPEELPAQIRPSYLAKSLLVSSERLDGILARLYHLSRSQSQDLFRTGHVFVNGRKCESSSRVLKTGEKVSARGYGKFIYDGIGQVTGKGKYRVSVRVYQ